MSRRPSSPEREVLHGGSALLLAGALVVAVVVAAVVGFAFYAPEVGAPVAGEADPSVADGLARPRDRATVEVAAYMAGDGGERPTLAEVIEFFALEEDTWRCTVTENWGAAAAERAARYAQRRLRVGDEIVLCLD